MSRRGQLLLRTMVIGGVTFTAERSAVNGARRRNGLRNRSLTGATEQRSRRASRMTLPPDRYPGYFSLRYPGYFSLRYLIIEKIIADRTGLALTGYLKAFSRRLGGADEAQPTPLATATNDPGVITTGD
jgi:hypothetical protein